MAVKVTGEVRVSGVSGVYKNTIVNTGLTHIADQMSNKVDTPMGWIACGSDDTAVASSDLSLGGETGRVAVTTKEHLASPESTKVKYTATFPAGVGTGTIKEFGVFNASSGGIMLARVVVAPITKGASDIRDIEWTITFS